MERPRGQNDGGKIKSLPSREELKIRQLLFVAKHLLSFSYGTWSGGRLSVYAAI